MREKVKADRHVAFGFVSPSGDGLKLGLCIDGQKHQQSFEAARDYFKNTYGLPIDESVKDRLRLCFVSYDPGAWTNTAAEALPLPAPKCTIVQKPTLSEKTGTAEPEAVGGKLEVAKLENAQRLSGGSIRAACPACRAAGGDHTGDHLLIDASGRFGCAKFPGDHAHRQQIWKLAAPPETDEQLLARLATLPPLEYERQREAAAATLGIKRMSALDAEVAARRPQAADKGQGAAVDLPDVEPWPDPLTALNACPPCPPLSRTS